MATIATPPRHTLRDAQGNILPQGNSRRRLEWAPMFDSALPSWLTVSGGSASVQTAAAGVPGAVLVLTGSGHVSLNIGGALALHPNLAAASIRVKGVSSLGQPNFNQLYLRLSDTGNTRGILLGTQCVDPAVSATQGLTSLVTQGAGGSTVQAQHKFSTAYPEARSQHKFVAADVGLLVNFEHGAAYGFDGDDEVHYRDIPTTFPRDGSVIHPRITAVARAEYPLLISHIIADFHY